MTEKVPHLNQEQPYLRTDADKERLIRGSFYLGRGNNGLYTMLEALGMIRGTKGDYTTQELISIIEEVKSGKAGLEEVTRTHGLRDTVERLLNSGKQRTRSLKEASVQLKDPRRQ